MSEFSELVTRLVETGADPNKLQDEFEATVQMTERWEQWGDTIWRRNLVCSKCGSGFGGVCHDPGIKEVGLFSDDPGYHKNQAGVKMIPYEDWRAKNEKTLRPM